MELIGQHSDYGTSGTEVRGSQTAGIGIVSEERVGGSGRTGSDWGRNRWD